jgi:hypothetical protein
MSGCARCFAIVGATSGFRWRSFRKSHRSGCWVRLGQPEASDRLSFEQPRQPTRLLFFRSVPRNRIQSQCGLRCCEALQAGVASFQLLYHKPALHGIGALHLRTSDRTRPPCARPRSEPHRAGRSPARKPRSRTGRRPTSQSSGPERTKAFADFRSNVAISGSRTFMTNCP